MGTNRPWNWRLTGLKAIKMMLIRPPHDQFQHDPQSWLWCSARSPLSLAIHPWNSPLEALAPWSAVGNWPLDTSMFSPPNYWPPEIKQPFLSTNTCLLSLAFEWWAARPEFSNTKTNRVISLRTSLPLRGDLGWATQSTKDALHRDFTFKQCPYTKRSCVEWWFDLGKPASCWFECKSQL